MTCPNDTPENPTPAPLRPLSPREQLRRAERQAHDEYKKFLAARDAKARAKPNDLTGSSDGE